MITKKRLLWVASLPLTIAVIFGILALLPPRPGVTKANFDRIQEGMTQAEVEVIFDKPGEVREVVRWSLMLRWRSDDGAVATVSFSGDDELVVHSKTWTDSDETILDRIRRWLHLKEPKKQ
jgi:hypothetical protein